MFKSMVKVTAESSPGLVGPKSYNVIGNVMLLGLYSLVLP